MSTLEDLQCPASGCGRIFGTTQARNSHLSQARSCSWYRMFEKTAAVEMLFGEGLISEKLGPDYMEKDGEQREDEAGSLLQAFEQENDPFFLVSVSPELEGGQGPGPSTQAYRESLIDQQLGSKPRDFDREVDTLYEEEQVEIGNAIRFDAGLRSRWEAIHGGTASAGMDNTYTPFASEMDWRIADWVVKEGIGNNTFNRLCEIPGVVEKLGLSYSNINGLHQRVDSIPNRVGDWHIRRLSFKDRPEEEFILRHRNVIDAVKSLWGDPALAEHLVYRPKQVFDDAKKGKRIYSEMWTGKWWQFVQNKLPKGATLAPLIVATDKTQLTQFSGSKQAYPVYLTLGNIPRHLRRKPSQQACVLLGYLPVDKVEKAGLTQHEHTGRYQRLFHDAMRHLFSPLVEAGENGIEMTSADGAVRRVHPVLACYVADFPEQCLVTCSKYGTCPKCKCGAKNLSNPLRSDLRTPDWTLDVMAGARASTTSSAQYFKACMAEEVSGYVFRPFWADLPHTNIHLSITPDVLHQLYQGVFKHIISWCQDILGNAELDHRIRLMPEAFGVRHFKNRISALSQISGSERKDMARILLGCIVDSPNMPQDAITAVRAILDFIHIAQYPSHDDATLSYLTEALNLWESKKSIFIKLGIHDTLNIPKFHSLLHYVEMIRCFGTTDNYNTEMFERLHIDYAKKAWRATNKRDEYPQMTKWLSRQENIFSFDREIAWILEQKRIQETSLLSTTSPSSSLNNSPLSSSPSPPPSRHWLPKTPSATRSLEDIATNHQVPLFRAHLHDYLTMLKPGSTRADLRSSYVAGNVFHRLDTFHILKFQGTSLEGLEGRDVIKASPADGGRFDAAIVLTGDDGEATGLTGTRIGRVKVMFKLPEEITLMGSYKGHAPRYWPRTPLAYIEWYSPPSQSKADRLSHNMVRIKKGKSSDNESVPWSIIPVTNIRQSVMLYPHLPLLIPESWTYKNVMDNVDSFYVSNWKNVYTYQTVYLDG